MSNQDSHLRNLMSPSKSGTFFAPFRSRSANPDGFDSKMRLWMNAIDEWATTNKKLTLSLKDIHQTFISDSGIKPDKECIRLVFSEMKRQSRLVALGSLKTSKLWSCATKQPPIIDNLLDPKGWLNWGVKKVVVDPANWALSIVSGTQHDTYSDLTDMSITDSMRFVCSKSLERLSQNLFTELVRISKAEKQVCFEWQHLLELIMPIMNTIIDATDGKDLLDMLNLLIDFLAQNHHVAIQTDNECRLIKIACHDDPGEERVAITQKDIAMARLLRARELLTSDADKCRAQAQQAKKDAIESNSRREIAKAKSQLRTYNRLMSCVEKKEAQLTNVEIMLEQLENTNSNKMIIQAYKDGADALRAANTDLEANISVLDDVYDATAEAKHLNEEMDQMLNNISCLSRTHDISTTELEAELNDFISSRERDVPSSDIKVVTTNESTSVGQETHGIDDKFVDELEQKLNSLVVCQDDPVERQAADASSEGKSMRLTAE